MLTNSLKLSGTTKTNFFELIFLQSDQKNWQKYSRTNLSSASDPLTCWVFVSVLRRGFWLIWVTPLFPVYHFKNRQLVRAIFCLKVFQILRRFQKSRKKFKFFFRIGDNSIWTGCVKHSLLLRENTCLRVSIC